MPGDVLDIFPAGIALEQLRQYEAAAPAPAADPRVIDGECVDITDKPRQTPPLLEGPTDGHTRNETR